MQNLANVSYNMCVHVGGPETFGTLRSRPLDGGVVDLRSAPPHILPCQICRSHGTEIRREMGP